MLFVYCCLCGYVLKLGILDIGILEYFGIWNIIEYLKIKNVNIIILKVFWFFVD